MLYEVLTGQNAAVGETMDELARSVRYDTPAIAVPGRALKNPQAIGRFDDAVLEKRALRAVGQYGRNDSALLSQNWQLS